MKKITAPFWGGLVQRFANMPRSRFVAGFLLITRMLILLLIFLNNG